MDKLHITGYSRVEHDLSIPVYHANLVDIKIKEQQAEIDAYKQDLEQTIAEKVDMQAEIDKLVEMLERIVLSYDLNDLEDDAKELIANSKA